VAPALPPRTPDPSTDDASERFVFYTVAEWNERKAVFRTVEAYLRAFTSRDPVVLVIKTSHRDQTATQSAGGGTAGAGTTAWSLARVLAGHRDPPAVQLVTRALTGAEITTLHRRGHCFVSLCRSEGWGLGAFDAAAHGKPVVTTGFGGHLDYLAGSPYLVGFELVPVIDPAGAPSYTPDQRWAEPDVDHAAALMRQIAADRQQASAVAAPIAAEVRRRYRPETIAAAFQSAVEQHRFREPMVPTMATTSRRP
jgi:glycosyltransferase involved in cell wall biosynthesis